ncbi:hypothetical protein ACJ41O_006603 [Fusarium nematophilum]
MFKTFGPGANCTLDLCPIEWTLYQYRPSLPVNITLMAHYVVALAIHVYLGYGGRVMLWNDPWSFAGFLAQMICITGVPVFYTASIYATLSRAIRVFAPEISRLSPRVLCWVFVLADITCLVLQAAGGALSSTSNGSSKMGVDIAMAGLILQVIVLVAFCIFFVDYMLRFAKLQRSRMSTMKNTITSRQRLFFGTLAASIILILGRCVYRVDELSEGYNDPEKITDEALFIGLEGVLVYLAVVCLFIGHPGFGLGELRLGDDSSRNALELERLRSSNASRTH